MEKKTTQRIIGMLVVIALVIILLPLLFGKNDMSAQASADIKSPAGLEQEQQVAANGSEQQEIMINADGQQIQPSQAEAQPTQAAAQPTQPTQPAQTAQLAQPQAAATADATEQNNKGTVDISPTMAANANENMAPQNNDAMQVASNDTASTSTDATQQPADAADSSSDVAPAVTSDQEAAKPTDETVPDASKTPAEATDASKAAPAKTDAPKKAAKPSKSKSAKSVNATSKNDKQGLAKLKSTAWAVQMGNFKNKDNARRLADRLRTAGYKAFTRENKTTGTVRVYIGPEYKQASATQLSAKVEQEFNMHGFIVPLKPLEL